MKLPVAGLVDAVARQHWTDLGYIHGCLEIAAGESSDFYSKRVRKERRHGTADAGTIRQLFIENWDATNRPASTLTLVRRPNLGIKFVDGAGTVVMMRKRPIDARTFGPLRASSAQPPLFGSNWSDAIDLAVLWDLDEDRAGLGSAVLAAVQGINKWQSVSILAETPLPLVTASTQAPPPPVPSDDDVWDVDWHNEETGDDQA